MGRPGVSPMAAGSGAGVGAGGSPAVSPISIREAHDEHAAVAGCLRSGRRFVGSYETRGETQHRRDQSSRPCPFASLGAPSGFTCLFAAPTQTPAHGIITLRSAPLGPAAHLPPPQRIILLDRGRRRYSTTTTHRLQDVRRPDSAHGRLAARHAKHGIGKRFRLASGLPQSVRQRERAAAAAIAAQRPIGVPHLTCDIRRGDNVALSLARTPTAALAQLDERHRDGQVQEGGRR